MNIVITIMNLDKITVSQILCLWEKYDFDTWSTAFLGEENIH